MNQIPITVKIDADVKSQAQALAKKLGLSLSTIIENKLREVVRERRIVFEEEYVPNKKTSKQLLKAQTDIKAGRNLSGPFKTIEEVEQHLNALGHAD